MLMQENETKDETTWAFHDEPEAYQQPLQPEKAQGAKAISWATSEFIANQKNGLWYLGLLVFIGLISGITYLLSKDYISVAFIVIVGILFAVIAGRKPRQLQYSVDDEGIKVGQKSYFFTDFKSFSLQRHGAIGYVSLLPLHRFYNELSIYFPPENEEKIFEALAQHLPNEQRKETSVDRIAKLVRF